MTDDASAVDVLIGHAPMHAQAKASPVARQWCGLSGHMLDFCLPMAACVAFWSSMLDFSAPPELSSGRDIWRDPSTQADHIAPPDRPVVSLTDSVVSFETGCLANFACLARSQVP